MTEIDSRLMWDILTAPEKDEVCLAFWSGRGVAQKFVDAVTGMLAENLHFRRSFLDKKSPNEKARFLREVIDSRKFQKHIKEFLFIWMSVKKSPMLSRYFEMTNVSGEGLANEMETPPPAIADVQHALRAIRAEFPERDVAIFIGLMSQFAGQPAETLCSALELERLDIPDMLEAFRQPSPPGPVPGGGGHAPATTYQVGEEFKTLDTFLISAAVASAFGEEGALSPERLEDLIEEIVELNARRQQSIFHRGFFHALFKKDLKFHFPGENMDRRMWYLCGVLLGLLRRAEYRQCIDLLNQEKEITKGLTTNGKIKCGAILLPDIYRHLLSAQEFSLLHDWLNAHLNNLSDNHLFPLLIEVQVDAASLVRRKKPSESLLLLGTLKKAMADLNQHKEFVSWFSPLIQRTTAQAHQLRGEFPLAETLLNNLMTSDFEDKANALSDLGLIRGGFRSIDAVVPRGNSNISSLIDALAKGEENFLQAVAQFGSQAINAHFCLGILHFLRGPSLALDYLDHFNHAYLGMLKRESLYGDEDLLLWTRFFLGVALLETVDPAELQTASEGIKSAIQAGLDVPLTVWERALNAATLFDDISLAEVLCGHLLQTRENEAYQSLKNSGVATVSEEIRPLYLEWLLKERLPVHEKWEELIKLLPVALRNSGDQAELILDALEEIATEWDSYRSPFVKLLQDQKNFSPAWDMTEAEGSMVKMYELNGQYPQAAEILKKHFFHLKQNGTTYHTLQARGVLERLCSYRLGDFTHLCQLLDEPAHAPDALEQLRSGRSVRVLYIGGDEMEEAHEFEIEHELAATYPGVKLTFYYPGWQSNWNVHLDKVRPLITQSDVVVLSVFVRTMFGRSIRQICNADHPWLSCTGRGKGTVKRSIEDAAMWSCSQS